MPEYSVNYKKLYHIAVNSMEDAIQRLISAQRECEELHLRMNESDPVQKLAPSEEL